MHRTLVSSFVLASALACILPMTAGCSSGDVSVGKSDQDLGLEQDTPPQACTTELKTCPDGSQVGRGGPNCEFAPCPPQACTTELKTCPDGSQVGRGGPNCEFAPCPPQACTTELKTCPDGSQVGRGGPNCEFAPCPR